MLNSTLLEEHLSKGIEINVQLFSKKIGLKFNILLSIEMFEKYLQIDLSYI